MSRITATVRCPMSEDRPSPTMNPMVASSAIHSPTSTINETGGVRNCEW